LFIFIKRLNGGAFSVPYLKIEIVAKGTRQKQNAHAVGSFIPRKCAKNDRNEQFLPFPAATNKPLGHTHANMLNFWPISTWVGCHRTHSGGSNLLDGYGDWMALDGHAAVTLPLAPPLVRQTSGLAVSYLHRPISSTSSCSCNSTPKSWLPFVVTVYECETSDSEGRSSSILCLISR